MRETLPYNKPASVLLGSLCALEDHLSRTGHMTHHFRHIIAHGIRLVYIE